jgi:iron complex outermembrane recepter protein
MKSRSLILLVGTSVLALGGQALAQATAASAPEVAEVIVTGSRVIQNGNSAPTPVTVLATDQLRNTAPGSLADGLAQVPQFRSSSRPGSFLNSQNSTGAFLNLRGLGASRTLVLLDGRRTPPTTTEGRTDINTYPSLLMQRVDIVTGGASAAYGSDAVSGVVNFILDSRFSGLKGEISAGTSRYKDSDAKNVALAWGKSFLDGRAHFVGSIDYSDNKGVKTGENRAWNRKQWNIIPNPTFATDGRTANLWRSGVTGAQLSPGGLIYAGPLKGTQFLTGGVAAPFQFGSEVSGGTMIGGDGPWSTRSSFATPIETLTTFGHLTFDVNDALSTFVEFSSSRTESQFDATTPNWSGTTAFTIFNNNAYLPADVRARMATANVTSFTLGRLGNDFGPPHAFSDTQSWRGAAGFSYKLANGWDIDGSVDNGLTYSQLGNSNIINQTKLFDAVDAVVNPANNQIVCRSELTAPHGCSPLNILGSGSASAAALAYIKDREAYSEVYVRQTAAALSVRGELGATWAGPIQVGAGFDYRRMSAKQNADAGSNGLVTSFPGQRGLPAALNNKLGVYPTGNMFSLPKVSQSVKEVYGEALVPLAADMAFARSLDLNAAYRYADYDTSGGVSSWKLGLTWQPVDSIRLRGTRSRDVRAPTLNDLYSPTTVSLGTLRDPVTGANNPIPGYSKGNADLKPELADTWTVGVVLAPTFAPGLSVSFDYYDIKMTGAIGNINRLTILNQCASGVTYYCQFIERLPNGTLVSTTVAPLNQNELRNSGYDVEVNYRTSLDVVGLPGEIRLRGLVAYLKELSTVDPFGGFDDRAGVNGGEAAGTPHWQGGASITYTVDNFTVFVQERVIGKGRYSNNYVVGGRASNSIDFMDVAGRNYTDVTLKYKFEAMGSESEAFLTINNLFDKDPPPSPTRVGTPVSILATNPTLYDIIGRYYTAGLRFKF